MHEKIGRARVAARIRSLNDQCKAGLARNPKVTLHTPMSGDLSAGLIAFEVAGVEPKHVVKQLLAKRIIASTSPYRVSYARLAPSLVNTPEQVEAAVRAVREISG
jgi:selenocysteine lyase/cysteine desulfurase